MLGFKSFATATTTIAGVELIQRIRKGQFSLERGPCRVIFKPLVKSDL